MSNQWYFARDGEEFGPFTAAQLKGLAASGRLRPHDTVWTDGADKRVPAVKVKHLFAAPAAPAAPGPSPGHAPASEAPAESPAALPGPPADQGAPPAPRSEVSGAGRTDVPRPENGPFVEEDKPRPQQPEVKARRVIDVKGGVVTSQDGVSVKIRKKCLKCGYNDTSVSTMPIRPGTTRVNFFCPKCKKSQQVEIRGTS